METNNMTTLHLRKSIDRSPSRLGFLLISLALTLFALPPTARAQEGALPNGSTAEGLGALVNQNNSGSNNTAMGFSALGSLTSASNNTATGANALQNNLADNDTATGWRALFSNTNGTWNTATGANALQSNTTGSSNTADGYGALSSNTNGGNNTAIGYTALASNGFDGTDNTGVGAGALFSNISGGFNTSIGFNALFKNTASNNTAIGDQTLLSNTTGTQNTATGGAALFKSTTGNNNTANGFEALFSNTTGSNNTADGLLALESNTTGHDNIAEGFEALANNKSGSSNIALGSSAGINLTTGSNNIDIGAQGVAGEANKIRIGKQGTQNGTFIAGISGVAVTGSQVVVSANGKLGVAASSARFKQAIKPMDKASEAILALKPVTFRYKQDLDPDAIPQFGLIAEQVEKVNPDLVVRDDEGKVMSVRYEAVNAMLLNEFLKQHGQVQQLKATVAQQQEEFHAKFAQQQKQIEALTSIVQKVSDQIALSQPAPQLVANP